MSFLNQLFPTQTRQQAGPFQAATVATPDSLQQALNLAYLNQLQGALQVPFGQGGGSPSLFNVPSPLGQMDTGFINAAGRHFTSPPPGATQVSFQPGAEPPGWTGGSVWQVPGDPSGPMWRAPEPSQAVTGPPAPAGDNRLDFWGPPAPQVSGLPSGPPAPAFGSAPVGPAQTGLAGLLQPQPGIFGLTPGQQGLLGGAQMALAGQLGGMGDYTQQLLSAMGGLGGLTQPNPAFSLSPQGQEAQGQAMQSLQAGLGGQAQQDYFNRIIAPTIVNNMTAQGQGRSGGIGEALGLAGTNFAAQALPYRAQMANQLMSLAQLPQTLAQQDVARQQQLIEQIMGNAPRGAPFASGLASNLLNLSRLPQQLSQQDLKRRQDLFAQMMADLPFRPGQTQQQLQGPRTTQTTQTSPQGGQAGLLGVAGLPVLGSLGLTALGGGQFGNVNFPGLGTQLGGLFGGLSNVFGPNPGSQSVGGSTGLLPAPGETPVLSQNLSGIQ